MSELVKKFTGLSSEEQQALKFAKITRAMYEKLTEEEFQEILRKSKEKKSTFGREKAVEYHNVKVMGLGRKTNGERKWTSIEFLEEGNVKPLEHPLEASLEKKVDFLIERIGKFSADLSVGEGSSGGKFINRIVIRLDDLSDRQYNTYNQILPEIKELSKQE